MAPVSLRNLYKRFGKTEVIHAVDLEVADGELVVLVGPSGSGKSTALRLVAGLDPVTSGRVRIDDRDVTGVPAQDRDLAMVFQSYALYPHKTVRDNLAFGLRVRGVDGATITERIGRTTDALGIATLLDRRPAQLSGGERQRVALGRAIVREPKGFLLDEPLSNLDPGLRAATRAELALLHRRLDATMIYVTHDQEEAMTLAGRMAVVRHGRLEQVGPPMEVFERPANVFVAEFVGTPTMNLLPARLVAELAASGEIGGETTAVLGVRPQDVDVVSASEADLADLAGRVTVRELLGTTALLHVRVEGLGERLVRIIVPADAAVALDATIGLRLRRDRVHRFDAAGQRI